MLGEIGKGYAPMQLRLRTRRLEMGSTCIGIARRACDMLCEHAKQRETFGVKLAERQAIQWWVAGYLDPHACVPADGAATPPTRPIAARTSGRRPR